MFAVTSLLLVVAISLVVVRIGTVVLVASGMSREAARFQARSAFTGAGFTTSESEQVVNHPLRRRVISTLMLLGNAGLVAAASTAILGFRSGALGSAWVRAMELVIGLLALVWLSRSPWVDRRLTRAIRRGLDRFTTIPSRDDSELVALADGYGVSELAVRPGDWVAGRRLAELALRDEGIAVLGVTRSDGGYVAVPTGETEIASGDVLVVYGRDEALCELDDRPEGSDGDLAHAAAVARRGRGRMQSVSTP